MTRKHEEHNQQVALFKWRDLSLHQYPELKWMHSCPNSARRSPRQGAWMKSEGMRAGIWDIFIPYPVQKWCGCYVEMKHGKNELTDEQRNFRNDNPCYYFIIAYDWVSAKDQIIQYLAGNRF